MVDPQSRWAVLWRYFLLVYAVLLLQNIGYLKGIKYSGILTPFFVAAVHLTYTALYMAPVLVLVLILHGLLSNAVLGRVAAVLPRLASFAGRLPLSANFIVYAGAVLAFTTLQCLILCDMFVLHLFKRHIGGFEWNLVKTPGGIDAMGAGTSTYVTFAALCLAMLALQLLLLLAARRSKLALALSQRLSTRRRKIMLALAFVLLGTSQALTYGLCSFRNHQPVLAAAYAFPLYQPVTFRRFWRSLGIRAERNPAVQFKDAGSSALNYPLNPIMRQPQPVKYNIVWLVSESLREDMLDEQIMPATHAFAKKAAWFRHHYSGGNGTRMGMFSMFYGLYGGYWFSFKDHCRGPVLMDVLLEDGYQLSMYSSAEFTYPEFDKTIFARIDSSCLHTLKKGLSYERDRHNIDSMLEFIGQRDPARPFMTFMFFESPHAPYHFPPETAIRQPYLEDMNYLLMNRNPEHMHLIKNRYINSCRHLDTQIQRVLEFLESRKLLESTIVLITGDHGEEFGEFGEWGHGMGYRDIQTRPPLVIHVPGQAPREVTRMTSHLDIPATILPLLGATNPPGDYSLGFDLFGEQVRDFTVISDWDRLCFVDSEYKAVIPLGSQIAQQSLSTKQDEPLEDARPFYSTRKEKLVEVMRELKKFVK